jgi:hypothetical protein
MKLTDKIMEKRRLNMEKKKKRFYSLGWLIFWIIVFWPIAVIYLIIKSMEAK